MFQICSCAVGRLCYARCCWRNEDLAVLSFNVEIPERLIDDHEVGAITSLSRSQRFKEEREGRFPARIQVGRRAVRWKLSEILAWIESRKIGPGPSNHDASPLVAKDKAQRSRFARAAAKAKRGKAPAL